MIIELTPEQLNRPFSPSIPAQDLHQQETWPNELIDQKRAEQALKLGLGIRAEGFNVFVSGEEGTGKLTAVNMFLEKKAAKEAVPSDWCLVYNFSDTYRPNCLEFPAGKASAFKKDMKDLITESMQGLMKVFDSEEYASRRQSIKDKSDQKISDLTFAINEKASKLSLMIKQTPWEIFTIPLVDGKQLSDAEFDKLPNTEKQTIQDKQTKFTDEMNEVLKQQRQVDKEAVAAFKQLDMEVAGMVINELINDIKSNYEALPEVIRYLQEVKDDILGDLPSFMMSHKEKLENPGSTDIEYLKRYEVNVLVDNRNRKGSPIVIETNPTYNNLIGTVEKESVMGSLITDFTMIRKGSLHKANGGYLILRASELFKNPFSWEALKRAIRNKEIVIEDVADQMGFLSTKTLKPEPIPLDVKVILVGNPFFYHVLYNYDSDFRNLFKVKSEFKSYMKRTPENINSFMSLFTKLCEKEKLLTPDLSALEKLVEYGSRYTEDQDKISTQFGKMADVLREANHYAWNAHANKIRQEHILLAIDEKIYRSNLIQERLLEMMQQKQLLISIHGEKTGQVNALSVIDLGDIMIGKPSRITCTVHMGKEGVLDIEREAELSGPIHTKGLLILTGFLSEQFFQDKPAGLSASLVFEQSYAEVEGDSASSTELYALLSALGNIPVKQGIAVTGSVNQKGEIQAIGGINEKIEGFFECCKLLGFDGHQGVLVPASNMNNLMLKKEVVEAVKEGKFKVWAVETIAEGMEVLTGIPYGDAKTPDTVCFMVNKTLECYAVKMKAFLTTLPA